MAEIMRLAAPRLSWLRCRPGNGSPDGTYPCERLCIRARCNLGPLAATVTPQARWPRHRRDGYASPLPGFLACGPPATLTSPDLALTGSDPLPTYLVCGETAPQRRQLLSRLQLQLASSGRVSCVLALDLVGADADAGPSPGEPPMRWQRYAPEPWADQIWEQLQPVLEPWSALLEGSLDHLERPSSREIPGLDALLSCLYLAHHAADGGTDGADALIVVLPPLEQALPLLQLACRGPDVLEGLWRPLLLWWSQTRQRLAQVELLLRLRLPSADNLALSEPWRQALERLAERLCAPQAEVLLALAAEPEDLASLGRRLVAIPLCGMPRLRLWLDAELPAAATVPLEQQFGLPLFSGRRLPSSSDAADWLNRQLPLQTTLWETPDHGVWRCRLYLPGLEREGLQVQRQDHCLQIRSSGMRLAVPMPEEWAQLTCRSARLDAPWLVIDFG